MLELVTVNHQDVFELFHIVKEKVSFKNVQFAHFYMKQLRISAHIAHKKVDLKKCPETILHIVFLLLF